MHMVSTVHWINVQNHRSILSSIHREWTLYLFILNLLSGIDPNIGNIVSDNVIIVKYLINHQEILMKRLSHDPSNTFQSLFLLSVAINLDPDHI